MYEYFIWIDGKMIGSMYSLDPENVISQALNFAFLRRPCTVEVKCDTNLFEAFIVVDKEKE